MSACLFFENFHPACLIEPACFEEFSKCPPCLLNKACLRNRDTRVTGKNSRYRALLREPKIQENIENDIHISIFMTRR